MTQNILAIDLGVHTGWALEEEGHLTAGVQTFELARGESPGMRYVRFSRWLDEIARHAKVIVYEATKRPYIAHQWRREWRRIATSVGVPKTVWNMDTRRPEDLGDDD